MRTEIEEEQFYTEVAKILNAETVYKRFPYSKKTRWNNRNPGNGRYEGRGLVRYYSHNCIHICLSNPRLNKMCKSTEEAYAALRAI